jgi:hypothetical protein
MNGEHFKFIHKYFPLPSLIEPSEPALAPTVGLREAMVANDHLENAPRWSQDGSWTAAPRRCDSMGFAYGAPT